MREGEIIYDYDWYPFMSSYDSSTCWYVFSALFILCLSFGISNAV